ncbi:MAG: alpha-L-rhamnosidase, partial [Cyclobacteriaceae bacterium]
MAYTLMKTTILILFLFSSLLGRAQFGSEQTNWTASWISVPDINETAPGLYLFRKTLNIDELPAEFPVRVSADNKYKLFVNGDLASVGPSLGDPDNWNYEVVDLIPYLKKGQNIIAAEVWNEGSYRAVNQFSLKTAFIVQGENEDSELANTDNT